MHDQAQGLPMGRALVARAVLFVLELGVGVQVMAKAQQLAKMVAADFTKWKAIVVERKITLN